MITTTAKPKSKRQAILRAFDKALRHRRYDEVTINEVASAVGIGKGTVYHYFKDKEDLLHQLVQTCLQDEIDAVQHIALQSMPSREKLTSIAACMSDHIRSHHALVRVMHTPFLAQRSPSAHEIMMEHHTRLDRLLHEVVRNAIASGCLRANLNPEHVLCLFKGMVLMRTLRGLHQKQDLPLDTLIDLLLTGLQP